MLGILICASSSTIGYHQYKSSIEKQYNDTAYNIADQAITYIDMQLVGEYVSLIKRNAAGEDVGAELEKAIQTDAYTQTMNEFLNLRKSMGANDIFLVYIDKDEMASYSGSRDGWTPVNYIYDSYVEKELSYVLGNKGTFNPDYIEETQIILETGKRSDSYFISKSQYGYNTYAMQPIKVGDDILLLGVEIPMTTIESALTRYVLFAVCVSIAIILLVIVIYIWRICLKQLSGPLILLQRKQAALLKTGRFSRRVLLK